MHSNKSGVASAVAIMALGVAWLLNNVGVMPAVEWVWTLGLAVTGIMILALLGLDKVTCVIGPFLVIGSFFSILRQAGTIPIKYEVPILVILLGFLLLVAVLAPLKSASWLFEEERR